MIGLLLWTFLYPLSSLGTRIVLEKNLSAQPESAVFRQTLTSEGLSLPTPHQESWSSIKALHLVPDAFTPFHWKIVLDNGALWDTAGYTLFSSMPDSFQAYSKPPEKLWKELGEKDRMFRAYQRFVVYPSLDRVIDEHSIIPRDSMQLSGKEVIFSDLRFGSTIPFVDTIQTRHNGEQINFRIMARILPDGTPLSVRFVTTTGAGGDSGWIPPAP